MTLHNSLYNKLAPKEDNLFFSSFSIQSALAMCLRGAAGDTHDVLEKLLGNASDEYYEKLFESINGDGTNRSFELVTANALWAAATLKVEEEYKKAVAESYGGSFNLVDYNNPTKAAAIINAWVEEKTKDKIKDLISESFINPLIRLILTNAIYFKGTWLKKFNKDLTKTKPFTTKSGTVNAQMMQATSKCFYYEDETCQAVQLPYSGDQLAMLIVLPTRDLTSFEKTWNENYLNRVVGSLSNEEVQVFLPRFKLETTFKLGQILQELGAGVAFSDHANFSRMSIEPLKISEVIHKAFVEVNEEGTEAAAATAVGMMRCMSTRRNEPKVFNANHPFIFFIRDVKNGTVLFSGHLSNPA